LEISYIKLCALGRVSGDLLRIFPCVLTLDGCTNMRLIDNTDKFAGFILITLLSVVLAVSA
jgi:hypothetical protein